MLPQWKALLWLQLPQWHEVTVTKRSLLVVDPALGLWRISVKNAELSLLATTPGTPRRSTCGKSIRLSTINVN